MGFKDLTMVAVRRSAPRYRLHRPRAGDARLLRHMRLYQFCIPTILSLVCCPHYLALSSMFHYLRLSFYRDAVYAFNYFQPGTLIYYHALRIKFIVPDSR